MVLGTENYAIFDARFSVPGVHDMIKRRLARRRIGKLEDYRRCEGRRDEKLSGIIGRNACEIDFQSMIGSIQLRTDQLKISNA